MKKQYPLLMFLLVHATFLIAQISLEKTYDNSTTNRYKMSVIGECYFSPIITTDPTFSIYGSNHTVLRQIPLVGKPTRNRKVFDIAETAAGELRFLTFDYDSSSTKVETLYMSDDKGNILFSQPYRVHPDSSASLSFMKTIGLTNRLMVKIIHDSNFDFTAKVYDLNGYNPKTYPFRNKNLYSELKRINLEVSGEKFYQTNNSDSIFFFNADFTPWKKFKIGLADIFNISQTFVNSDTLIEVVSTKYYLPSIVFPPFNYDSIKLVAINELGQEVSSLRIPKRGSSMRDDIEVAMVNDRGFLDLFSFQNGIHIAKTFSPGLLSWGNVGRYGKKYVHYNTISDTVWIYNENLSLWKIITLPVTQNLEFNGLINLFVPENSGLLHIAFIERSKYNAPVKQANLKVINENSDILLTISDFSTQGISQYDGLSPKLMVRNTTQNWTKVYSFNYPNATKNVSETLKAQVFPNPFDNTLSIKLDVPHLLTSERLNIQVVDLAGKQLLSKTKAVTSEIPLPEAAQLAKGFYFLRVSDDENRQVVLKIVKE